MNGISRILLSILLVITMNTASGAEGNEGATAVKTANALASSIREGNFEQATTSFTDEMKAALTPGSLRLAVGQLSDFGEVTKTDPPEVSVKDGFQIVVIREHRTAGVVDMTVAIDGSGKVAGLHFTPGQDAGTKADQG